MKKINPFLLLLTFIGGPLLAQDNLVTNPSFEETSKPVKAEGQVSYANGWKSATMVPADLFMTKAKNDDYAVPENKYGAEKPRTGDNYAGINLFGYRGRIPRTYIQTELKEPLKAGKTYCMKYFVSMSDMSKYAVNNLSMYIAKEEVSEKSGNSLKKEPQVRNLGNKVFSQQFLWKPVCGPYKAEGGEKFIVIGNFDPDETTLQERVKLSRDFSGMQLGNAYYYIDDVSVVDMEGMKAEDCVCEKIAGGKMDVVFKSFGTDDAAKSSGEKKVFVNSDGSKVKAGEAPSKTTTTEEKTPAKPEDFMQDNRSIIFAAKSANLTGEAKEQLDRIAAHMNEYAKLKLVLSGHADPSESDVPFLGKRRAFATFKYLEGKGLTKTRVRYEDMGDGQPSADGSASANRRVEFAFE